MRTKVTLVFALLLCTTILNAQWEQNSAQVAKSSVEITLDGDASDWPADIEKNAIERDFTDESPAFDIEPTWAALWTETDLYILIEYTDNDWVPTFDPAWKADKIEVAIDVNEELADEKGASSQADGHYQISPGYDEDNQGIEIEHSIGFCADTYDNGKVIREVRIPFENAIDVAGDAFIAAIGKVIGFDITVADNDGANRQRRVWSNFGEVDENWKNMDQAGTITFVEERVNSIATKELAMVKLYPNPATESISFEGTYDFVELFDVTGKLVKTFNKVSNRLNVEDVNKGMYIVNFGGITKSTFIKN